MKLRRYVVLLVAIALTLGVLTYFAIKHPYQEAYTPDNLIRLHVIANSDRPADQALKYEVRDVVLRELSPRLATVSRIEEAEAVVRRERDRLEEIANSYLASRGVPYRARVELGNYAFPTRSYYDLVLPAGEYKAVRVVLGEGEGQNWWCVLFPPLCFVDIATTGDPLLVEEAMAGAADSEVKGAVRPQIVTRWRILEALQHSQRKLARLWSGS